MDRNRRAEVLLFLLGLLLRAPGLLFNGMADPDPWVFDWGPRVTSEGLAHAFSGDGGYGILSFWFAGAAYRIADAIPRFWWAPHKFFELCFEAGILWLLARLLGAERKRWAYYLFWLNPWFILHGAWQGYWDGAHTSMVLLSLLLLRGIRDDRLAWAATGAALLGSAMFKPQGLMFFGAPVLLLLTFQFLRERRAALVWYAAGASSVLLAGAVFLVLGGGDAAALPRQYVFVSGYMVALCNNCVSVWRPVTRLFQAVLDQPGPTYALVLPPSLFAALDRTGIILAVLIILAFTLRIPAIPGRRWTGDPGRFARLCGWLLLVICGLGWLRPSDPAMHPSLVLGRYSMFYFVSLLVLLAAGLLLILAGPALLRLTEAILRGLPQVLRAGTDMREGSQRHTAILLLMIVTGLTVPQLGTRAHENHAYAALVLMILLAAPGLHAPSFRRPWTWTLREAKQGPRAIRAAVHRPLLPIWLAMCGAHFLVILSHARFGRPQLLPSFHLDTAPAQPLLAKIRPLLESIPSDPWIAFQGRVNEFIGAVLPPEPVSTIAASIQTICFALALRHLWNNR
ncbi:MAG: hypothetical protein HYT87_17205 [Nitrospirae bacterium]|nr:hypothetical protein [Nitrospirota bacterium]